MELSDRLQPKRAGRTKGGKNSLTHSPPSTVVVCVRVPPHDFVTPCQPVELHKVLDKYAFSACPCHNVCFQLNCSVDGKELSVYDLPLFCYLP